MRCQVAFGVALTNENRQVSQETGKTRILAERPCTQSPGGPGQDELRSRLHGKSCTTHRPKAGLSGVGIDGCGGPAKLGCGLNQSDVDSAEMGERMNIVES